MRRSDQFVAKCLRWALITPVLPMSIWMSMMGVVGLGFGAGTFMLGYLLAAPAFFLNMISPRWGAVGALGIVALDYIPRAIMNWPEINPLVLLTSRADGMLILNLVLSIASAIVWEIMTRRAPALEDHAAE